MANEIVASASVTATQTIPYQVALSLIADMTGKAVILNSQEIGTSWEALDYGDISGTPRLIAVKNIDTTNYIDIATDNGGVNAVGRLNAGDFMILPIPGTLYFQAHTAACELVVWAAEQ